MNKPLKWIVAIGLLVIIIIALGILNTFMLKFNLSNKIRAYTLGITALPICIYFGKLDSKIESKIEDMLK